MHTKMHLPFAFPPNKRGDKVMKWHEKAKISCKVAVVHRVDSLLCWVSLNYARASRNNSYSITAQITLIVSHEMMIGWQLPEITLHQAVTGLAVPHCKPYEPTADLGH